MNTSAFETPGEADLVNRLREQAQLIVSLVAEDDGINRNYSICLEKSMETICQFKELDKYFKKADVTDIKIFESRTTLRRFIASMLSYYPWWLIQLYRIRKLLVAVFGLAKHEEPGELPHLAPEDVSFTPGENAAFFIVRCAKEDLYWISESPDDRQTSELELCG